MKTSYFRWVIEVLLVFGSVLTAFFVEDYREERQEQKDYLNTLINFRNDVHEDIWSFRVYFDTSNVIQAHYRYGSKVPYYQKIDSILYLIHSISNDEDISNNSRGFELLTYYIANEDYEYGSFIDFRDPSPYYEELKKYPKQVKNDSLSSSYTTYFFVNKDEFHYFKIWNDYRTSLIEYLLTNADYQKIESNRNQLVMESSIVKNHIQVFMRLVGILGKDDRIQALRLSWILDKLDGKLHEYGIETSALDNQFMIPREEWIN